MSENSSLAQALATLQSNLPEIKKDQTADVPTKSGGSYSFSYADLAQITRLVMPLLGGLGLSFTAWPTVRDDGKFVLEYKLMHVSGESEGGSYPLPTGGTPQATGSAITYARRYCLCAATGIAPDEDDDDAAAAQAEAERNQQRGTTSGQRSEWRAPTESRSAGSNSNTPATKPQLQKMHIQFSQAEWDDKADRLRAASALVGRELSSSTEMTKQEASKVIDALEKVLTGPDPATRLTELVGAAKGGES